MTELVRNGVLCHLLHSRLNDHTPPSMCRVCIGQRTSFLATDDTFIRRNGKLRGNTQPHPETQDTGPEHRVISISFSEHLPET